MVKTHSKTFGKALCTEITGLPHCGVRVYIQAHTNDHGIHHDHKGRHNLQEEALRDILPCDSALFEPCDLQSSPPTLALLILHVGEARLLSGFPSFNVNASLCSFFSQDLPKLQKFGLFQVTAPGRTSQKKPLSSPH